jgi:urea transport system permease protein
MTGAAFGIGRIHWNWLAALAVLLAALPLVSETNTPILLAVWALFALSLALMWGFAGILSFGHAAYFGLGAYTYAIASFNIGESTVPVLLALIVPAAVAAVIGAMMFYGRISDVYLGVMTLVVTLILNRFMNATAGDAYKIGNARLGGFNGIPAFPTLNVPGDPKMEIYGTAYYYVVIVCLFVAYLVARWILSSAFGRTLIGIRENETRMELLGYNVPAYKTAIFSVCAAMAGLAGCLFANWAEIVTPSVFSLGHQTMVDNSLVLGAILILVVLLIPRGFAPSFTLWRRRLAQAQVHRRQARGTRRRRIALQDAKQ